MGFFGTPKPEDGVKRKVLNRLRNTSSDEIVRWADNVHTGIGLNISEIRKSLSRNPEQALIYIEDLRLGATSLLAAAQVLEERSNSASQG